MNNFCYADEIDPIIKKGNEFIEIGKGTKTVQPEVYNPMPIIIGLIVAIIVAISIIVLVKSKKNKDEKNEK